MENEKDKQYKDVGLLQVYPIPKTYDEKQAERARLDAKKLARQPRHIGVRSAILLTILYIFTVWMSVVIPKIAIESPYAGVPLSLLIGFVWIGLIYWSVRDIRAMFAMRSTNATPFFLTYAACVTPLVVTGLKTQLVLLPFASLAVLHLFITTLIAGVVLSSKLATNMKLIILCTMWGVAFVSLFFLR